MPNKDLIIMSCHWFITLLTLDLHAPLHGQVPKLLSRVGSKSWFASWDFLWVSSIHLWPSISSCVPASYPLPHIYLWPRDLYIGATKDKCLSTLGVIIPFGLGSAIIKHKLVDHRDVRWVLGIVFDLPYVVWYSRALWASGVSRGSRSF